MKVHFIRSISLCSLSLFLWSCEKPKLKSELENEPLEEAAPKKPVSISEKRNAVIGKTFAKLTLGETQFIGAKVIEITNQAIVVSHRGGVDTVPWSRVPKEVQKQWGYDMTALPFAPFEKESAPPSSESSFATQENSSRLEQEPPVRRPESPAVKRSTEIAQKERMLGAQLEGIRALESDLSRHTLMMNNLRAQLRSVKAKQSNQRTGGVRIEQIGGQSVIVDRRQDTREIQAKLEAEEQLVAQFSKSLQAARATYQALQLEVIKLRQR